MNRRAFLATGGALTLGSVAGCLGDDGGTTREVGGHQVTFVPPETAHEWLEDDDARFVDTRQSIYEYDQARIPGAVFSPATNGLEENDPVAEWPADARIVTYCTCPYHYSGNRAAALLETGYEDVQGLDQGLQEWIDREYPVDGSAQASLPSYEVRGRSAPSHAGETVEIREPTTGQAEAGPVGADGSYELTLHFHHLSSQTPLVVDAPDYRLEAPLSELTAGVVGP